MVIEELGLSAFRNYNQLHEAFSGKLNLFVGRNGQGKTNLLEALYLLSHLESFRTRKWVSLIKKEQSAAYVQGKVSKGGVPHTIRIEITPRGRRVWLDQQPVLKISNYISSFYSLLFNAESLFSFRGYPEERRIYFDRFLAFVDKTYLKELKDFRVIVSQKNRALKLQQQNQLPEWNYLFVQKSCGIIKRRRELIDSLNQRLTQQFQMVTGRDEPVRATYQASLKGEAADWAPFLEANQQRELAAGHALWGPHRDGYRLAMEERGDDLFSQGEYRAVMLALLLALNQELAQKLSFKPVLVLDDLYAELDRAVQQRVTQTLARLPNQIFITHTESSGGQPPEGARIRKIQAGTIE